MTRLRNGNARLDYEGLTVSVLLCAQCHVQVQLCKTIVESSSLLVSFRDDKLQKFKKQVEFFKIICNSFSREFNIFRCEDLLKISDIIHKRIDYMPENPYLVSSTHRAYLKT